MSSSTALCEATAFLRAVLPERREGEVYRLEVRPWPGPTNNFLDTKKMAVYLLAHGHRPYNAFFALATFPSKGRDRKAEHALRFATVWIDLDVGPGKPFATKEESLAHVARFPLRPVAVVDSGRGLHVYWLLDDPSEGDLLDKHMAVVKGLALGWRGDPAAALRSQILRVPGTMNVDSVDKKKDGRDLPVRLLRLDDDAPVYSLDDFVGAGVKPFEHTDRKPPVAEHLATGTRHPSLLTEAARLRNLHYDADEIEGALQVINRKRSADGGVPEDEVRQIAEWGGTLEPRSAALRTVAWLPRRGPIDVA